jgi:Txe/YoeB family toxin of Txe-Axe toxin-antitoxin module
VQLLSNPTGTNLCCLKKVKLNKLSFKSNNLEDFENWEKAHIRLAPPIEINFTVARLLKIICRTANKITKRDRLC